MRKPTDKLTRARRVKRTPTHWYFYRFFFAVGYAITRWAYVNGALYNCFHLVLGTTQKKASILYYRQREMGQRLQLVDALMVDALSEGPMLDRWREIRKTTERLLPLRNHIAHEMPMEVIHHTVKLGARPQITDVRRWWEISTDLSKSNHKKPQRAVVTEIDTHIRDVELLSGALRAFHKGLIAERTRPPAPRPQPHPARPPHSKKKTDRTSE